MSKNFNCQNCGRQFVTAEKLADHRSKDHAPFQSDEELNLVAKQAIWDALRSDGTNEAILRKAEIGLKHRSTKAKEEQTQSALLSTVASMAARLSGKDPKKYAGYIKKALPGSPVANLLYEPRDERVEDKAKEG